MKLHLNGKTALIAGASKGLGRAAAQALAAEGCRVIAVARDASALSSLVDHLRGEHGCDAEYLVCDLDVRGAVEEMLASVRGMVGTPDILIANNGGPAPGTFSEIDEAGWEDGWNRTLMSTVRLLRGCAPGMVERGWGRIIVITSITVRQPVPTLLLSNAYRAAVTGAIRTLSDEIACRGVTVNAVAPGFIATERVTHLFEDRAARNGSTADQERSATVSAIPAGRLGSPEEVGATIAFLASEQAAFITGTTVLVDGGMHRGLC